MNGFANHVISDAWPLGKLGILPPEIRALIWRLLIPAERAPPLDLSTYLAEWQRNDGHVFNSNPLSALMQLSGTHHNISSLCSEDLDGRQFNLSLANLRFSSRPFAAAFSLFLIQLTTRSALSRGSLIQLPSHAIAVFARTIPHARSLKLTFEFDLATYSLYASHVGKLPQLRRLVVDIPGARRYGSIKRLDTTIRINMERYNARIKRQESEIGGSPFVFSGQANVADAVGKSAALITQPILHIIRSRGFGHGGHLIVTTESFDQIGHQHARWVTWAQLEDVYYKALPNYPN